MEAADSLDPPIAAEHSLLRVYVCINSPRMCSLLDGHKDDYRHAHQSRLLQASAGVATTVLQI
jgi:hypothetical protein